VVVQTLGSVQRGCKGLQRRAEAGFGSVGDGEMLQPVRLALCEFRAHTVLYFLMPYESERRAMRALDWIQSLHFSG